MDNFKAQNRISKLTESLLNYSTNTEENIFELVKLCGEMLGATCALYINLRGNSIYPSGKWKTSKDNIDFDSPEDYICLNAMKSGMNKPVLINNLPSTKYFLTDPNIKKFKLQTFFGKSVIREKELIGTLCLMFDKDFKPQKDDIDLLVLLASAISIEEEKKLTEKEANKRESLYRTLFDNSPSGILIEDSNGKIIDCNIAVCNIFGFTKKEFLGKNVKTLVPKVFYEEVKENIEKILSGNILDHTVTNIKKDGSYCFLALRESKITLPDGNPGILVIANDITKRREIEIALRQSEEKYRSLVENITDIIFSTDLEGKFTYVSPLIKEFSGYDIEELIGTPFTDYIYPDDLEGLVESFHKTLSGIVEPYEFRIFDKKGEIKTIRSTCKLHFENGNPVGLHGILIDITLKKNFEKELKKAKEVAESAVKIKSQFLTTISHEIRTPMNGVIGMTDLLMQTELNNEQKEFVETIKSSGEILLSLINDILDFSKIESGKLKIEDHAFNLKKCVDDLVNSFYTHAKEKKLKINTYIDSSIPESVISDSSRIRQIMSNLISNAIKYTEKGQIDIKIKKLSEKNDLVELQFSVKDTGIGIEKDSISQLFQPFNQLDSSTTRKYGGTGLGLIISKQLVEMLKGKISVESEPGKGSEFTFSVFCKKDNENRNLDEIKKPVNLNLSNEYPLQILLVEDNLINQKVAIRLLKRFGYDTDVASNGAEAVEAVKKKKYDIIFMDIQMPVMDGIQATKEIIKMSQKDTCPIIIAMTAAVMKGDKEKCLESGMKDYIPKPILPEVVQKAIEKWGKR